MAVFIVDTNFFIEAHRSTYPLDIATSFWLKVKQLAQNGNIISIDKVKNEIYANSDDLEAWCKDNLPENFFKNTSEVTSEYARVAEWTMSMENHYLPNAINEFLSADEADTFLIAYALAELSDRIIVTQEISQPERKNKIKIPEPCNALGIRYVNVIEMFRELDETF